MTTIIVAIMMVVFLGFFTSLFKKVLVKKGEENRAINVQVSKWILQALSGIKEIKVINGEQFLLIIMTRITENVQ